MREVLDLMEIGRWHEAEAQLALLPVAGEPVAMDVDWKWPTWLLSHPPEPPRQLLIAESGSAQARPISKLADPTWFAAAIAFTKEVAVLQEAHRKAPSARAPNPRRARQGGKATGPTPRKGDRAQARSPFAFLSFARGDLAGEPSQ